MATVGEEDEIAWLEVPPQDGPAARHVAVARVRQRDSEVAVHEAHEARAVEAGARRRAAPCVRNSPEPPGVVHDPHTERVHPNVVVPAPMTVSERVPLRRDDRVAREARQRPDECHEQSGGEYEQQYEKAEWPHWKLEGLPSMATRPITRRPLACRRGLLPAKQGFRTPAIPLLGDNSAPLCSNRQV